MGFGVVLNTFVLLEDGVRFELGGGGSVLLMVVAVALGGVERAHAQGGQVGGLGLQDVRCPNPSGSRRRRRWVVLGVEKNLSGQKCPSTRAPMVDHFCVYQFSP